MIKYLFPLLLLAALIQGALPSTLSQGDVSIPQNNYPVRAVYIDKLMSWYGMDVAKNLGLPGYATPHVYNHILFAFWSCAQGPLDVAKVWQNISMYLGDQNPFGTTDREVQLGMKKVYNQAGIRILVSAFGATQMPTTMQQDPEACGTALGNFVLRNNLDGADVDWQDNSAMEAGTGQQWLITFTKALRRTIPDHIVTHCPQGPYFKQQYYKNGAYVTVNKAVGDLINFYIIQFYNQGDTKYDTYEELVEKATGFFSGTALMEIQKRGVDSRKLIICKPVTPQDADNTGYMAPQALRSAVDRAQQQYGWFGGIGHWQYPSDATGSTIQTVAGGLIEYCQQNPTKCR